MKKKNWTIAALVIILGLGITKQVSNKSEEWQSLFNGKDLTGWDTYIGPPLDDAGKKISDQPIGLNNDPKKVFTVVSDNGENVIRISGECWGGISTREEHENFHLQLKFKWGKLSWGSKKGKKKDSGLLYFAVGLHGADYYAWMRSQEFQIEETNCGDYWGVAGGMQDVFASKQNDSTYVYDPKGNLYNFSAKSPQGRHCVKRSDAENPSGDWNTLDLYCHGDTSVHVINGRAMMVLLNSKQWQDGKALPLTNGKFQIQSEGAEVFYKDIKVKALGEIPKELLQ